MGIEETDVDVEVVITNWGGLSGRFLNLLNSGEMFDVTFQVGDQLYGAHKLILSASSDVFKTMLTSRKWSESRMEIVNLYEEPLCEYVFGKFIHYIYTGQLYLSHKTVCSMLTLADKYNVKELIPLCQKYMLENLDAPSNISCVLHWWSVSNLRNDKEMEAKILSYIDLNFTKIIQSSEFVSCNIEIVEQLLGRSKLVVSNELDIYCGVKNWIDTYINHNRNMSNSNCSQLLSRLMRHIRWPMMTLDELGWLKANLQNHCYIFETLSKTSPNFLLSLLTQVDSPQFQKHLSAITEHYNNLCLSSQEFQFTPQTSLESFIGSAEPVLVNEFFESKRISPLTDAEKRKMFTPRLYICDYWGTELTITNFASFPKYGVQTFFFSTPKTGLLKDDGCNLDWEVEMYPKGIHFPPATLIGVERNGTKVIDETFIDTVRLSIMSRSSLEMPLKVEVNILVRVHSTSEPRSTFYEQSHCRTCLFEYEGQRQIFNDIVHLPNMTRYLQPIAPVPDLHLPPTDAFSLCVLIHPIAPD